MVMWNLLAEVCTPQSAEYPMSILTSPVFVRWFVPASDEEWALLKFGDLVQGHSAKECQSQNWQVGVPCVFMYVTCFLLFCT